MRKIFLIALGIVVLSAMGFYPQFDTFAGHGGGHGGGPPKVRSSKLKHGRCKTHNNFRTGDDVRVKGKRFPDSTTFDIYVIENKKWKTGDKFGPLNPLDPQDETSAVETVVLGLGDREIPCTTIWTNPLTSGRYDIVVDTGPDGIPDGMFDPADGDAIDGRSNNAGFRVRGGDGNNGNDNGAEKFETSLVPIVPNSSLIISTFEKGDVEIKEESQDNVKVEMRIKGVRDTDGNLVTGFGYTLSIDTTLDGNPTPLEFSFGLTNGEAKVEEKNLGLIGQFLSIDNVLLKDPDGNPFASPGIIL